ncbi:MAG: 2,3-bisphosphoglycerate-independent phosphoglycerate mutase [Candidatus Babeliaceae bacterium]|nr:2,3-bisphosphoglycerate-independent phosphoglycerate mutase [Candidatus Babeliaceae bacterium]
MIHSKKPVGLIILDGFGYRKDLKDNAITPKTMPFFFSLLRKYPWTTLAASGNAVGLPEGIPGNSAVGHFTLGAGKIFEQPLTQFSRMIHDGTFFELPVIKNNFIQLAKTGKTLHIMGLISDGGSHSKVEHTQAVITAAGRYGIKKIVIHAVLDGRDVPQKSAMEFLERIEKTVFELPAQTNAEIGTLQGRLYAMDRNENIERLKQAYRVITQEEPHPIQTWQNALENYYGQGFYDETIPPMQLIKDPTIKNGDGFVFVNIRADRSRELYLLLKHTSNLSFLISGIDYQNDSNSLTICTTPNTTNTLNDYLEKQTIKIFSIAESEKYAHITYFFNGGREKNRPNETRVIIQSDNPTTFVHEPAMKAREITHALVQALDHHDAEFYLVNYANADMVGHSGNLEATKKAVGVLDKQLKRLYETFVIKHQGTLYITGDHGNAEDKKNSNPAHTTSPVYFLVVSEQPINKNILTTMKTLADVKDVIIKNSFYYLGK